MNIHLAISHQTLPHLIGILKDYLLSPTYTNTLQATCCQPLIFLSTLSKGIERFPIQGNMLLDHIKA